MERQEHKTDAMACNHFHSAKRFEHKEFSPATEIIIKEIH
jgi:hypothetical protein